jgi:hypothetical protein
MAVIYRTAGAWGAGQGSNLSAAQVDNNFWDNVSRLAIIEAGIAATVNQIASITVVGSQMTFLMEDATTFGPFTLPVATFSWRGAWTVDTTYSELDLFFASGFGTYIVLLDHVSDPYAFDPFAVDIDSNPLYFQLFGDSLNFLQLTDCPDAYTGKGGYDLRVKATEDAVEFVLRDHAITFWFPGTYIASQVIYREVFNERTTLPTNLLGTEGRYTAPTGSPGFDITINGVSIGTLTFVIGTNDTPSITSTETICEVNDYLEIVAPAGSPDATLANIALAIKSTRVL